MATRVPPASGSRSRTEGPGAPPLRAAAGRTRHMPFIRQSIAAMVPYTPGEQPQGEGIVKLNTNENPYGPSPRVADVLRSASADDLRLYPDPVSSGLVRQIAALHGCGTDQVFVGNGSDEVLALCARAFAERDGTIGWFDPSYSLYPVLAAIENIPSRPVPLPADFSWTMPADYRASLFYLTNPNAPTSRLFPKEQVTAFCRAFPGVVLVDEAYVDFAPGDCLDLARQLPNTLVARTLSKSYSLAGIRLGYAVGPAPLVAALYKIKDSYNVSLLTQRIAAAALADPAWMRRNAARIVATRDRVTQDLRARGWQVFDSASNFLFAKPPARPARDVFEALRARRIYVRHFAAPSTTAYLRITVGTDAQMDALLAALDEVAGGATPTT